MNGYISKPYTEEKLFQVINDAVKTNDKLRNKILPKVKPSFDRAPKPTEKLYDLTMLESIGKDDKAFSDNIITIFVDTMPGNIEGLVHAFSENNFEQVGKIAHKMKSSIDLLGISSLKFVIRKLENADPGDPECEENIEKVRTTLKEAIVQLKELL